MQRLTILGSTGSVGQSTLKVLARHPQAFAVAALTARRDTEKMLAQCLQFRPSTVVMIEEEAAQRLRASLLAEGLDEITVLCGEQSLCEVARDSGSDTVMSAIVGAAGLLPTLAAVKAGKRVLIANKEPLVMTGDMLMREAGQSNAVVLPIDSEHNAIFQCLPDNQDKSGVRKLHLTASGGPFRERRWSELTEVTPDQACAHPNWSMGRKISVDSATMMNKGLELIEATALFGLPASQVDVVIHPQSIVHSMVEYLDGSFLAQLGAPDMCIPIAHALSWPQRIDSGADTLNICEIARLDFRQPDLDNIPCLRLARQAADHGGAAPIILNAANEVAVEAFLTERIRFTAIPEVVEATLEALAGKNASGTSVESVLQIDNEARVVAGAQLESRMT